MMAATEASVIYPVFVVKVNNILCRALQGTGAASSYASSALLGNLIYVQSGEKQSALK